MDFSKNILSFVVLVFLLLAPISNLFSDNSTSTKNLSARTIPVLGQSYLARAQSLDDKMKIFLEKWQLPGATLAVIDNNRVIVNRAYGWANIEKRVPMRPENVFRIGSVSKTITAMTILYLDQIHRLKINEPVFKLLNELQPFPGKVKAVGVDTITIYNLLQMSAGWYTDRPQDYDPVVGPWSDEMLKQLNYSVPPRCESAARLMLSQALQYKPGTQFSYSNFNYCLLGLVVNQVTKTKGHEGYESYVKKTILEPLGITSLQIGSTALQNAAPNEVYYYASPPINLYSYIDRALDGLPYGDTELLEKNAADGGWIASAIDLARLLQALHDGKILDKKHFDLMVAPQSFKITTMNKNGWNSALGWDEIGEIKGDHYYLKTGSFTGTQAVIILTDKGTSYAVLFNAKARDYAAFVKELKEILFEIK